MYAAYFGLKENPFTLSPDPRFLFLSEQHRDALNCLIYGIKEKKGFVLVSGGIGLGKTTICRSLLNSLDDSVETALIFNTAISDLDLLETILGEYGIEIKGESKTKKNYIDALNDFLLQNYAAGKTTVLLIDEAQNLSYGVLEQIRMLSNLESETEKLIQIILIGQPELANTLILPALRQLNERIAVRYDLKPLSHQEVAEYVQHRLLIAQGPGSLKFTKGAFNLVYTFSEGIPRRINALCDRSLLIAYTKNTSIIDRKIVKLAVHDIGVHYFQKTMSTWKKIGALLTTQKFSQVLDQQVILSYINNALRKVQKEEKTRYAAYDHIVSVPEKNTYKLSKKRLSIIGIVMVLFFAAIMIVIFYGKEDNKNPITQRINTPSVTSTVLGPPPATQSVLDASGTKNISDSRKLKTTGDVRTEQKVGEAKALYEQALQYHRQGKLEEAKILYRKVVEMNAYNVQAFNNLGVIYMGEKNFNRAIMRFNNALNIKPDYVDAHYNLACLYAKKNDPSRSLSYLKKAIHLNPEVSQWAKNDGDLETLIHLPEFKKLMEKQ